MIHPENFTNNLLHLMEETCDAKNHGIYLDQGTSLLETLETVSAQEASIPVGGKCASLAAQVAHVTLYFEVLERYIRKQDVGKVDWGEVWRTVENVTSEEWEQNKHKLQKAYERIHEVLRENEIWDEDSVGNAMAIVVHAAYHLGEIRQALCTLKK